ncbi:MAG: tetratricopeptide repeat protein [Gammaproteobacteria bacterium]|nr:tetratricopeptide repeat protein [Gammaproteobacteria bacterium]
MKRLTTLVTMIAVLVVPGTARALDWEALWLNPDQRAADRMAQDDYEAAAETFRDPHWRATARYRAGDYGDAAEAWAALDDTRAHYNRGNALARAGDIESAMVAYETVLEREPGHADARHNLALLRELVDESEESGPSGDGGERNDGGDREADGDPDRGDESSGDRQDPGDGGGQTQPADRLADEVEPGRSGSRDEPALNDPGDEADGTRTADDPETDATLPDEQAAMDQWLRRIPDDPGGLLRRKLLYQYTRRDRGDGEIDPW